jgi:hypothetical protein
MSKITKQELLTMVRNIEEALTNVNTWKTDISEVVWEIKKQIDILQETPMDKDEHNMQLQIDILMNIYKNQQRDITNMKEWVSNLEIEQTQPNVTLPKSTHYDAEVGSRLDSLEARMAKVEEMLKTSICDAMTKEIPEAQNIRKVVFVWRITEDGKLKRPVSEPYFYQKVEELFNLGDKFYLFKADFGQGAPIKIFIGHYE